MDVVWTAEFAQAGLDQAVDRSAERPQVTQGTLPAPLKTATYKGQAVGRAGTTNTQLLWYRKDLVKTPAQDLGRDDRACRAALAKQNGATSSRSRAASTRA